MDSYAVSIGIAALIIIVWFSRGLFDRERAATALVNVKDIAKKIAEKVRKKTRKQRENHWDEYL